MPKTRYLWKDEQSSGSCCPALYRIDDGFLVQGKRHRATDNGIRDLAADEEVVYVPRNVLSRLIRESVSELEVAAVLKAPYMVPFARQLISQSRAGVDDVILDYACGVGFVALAAKDVLGEDASVTGVDIDPLAVLYAQQQHGVDAIWSLDGITDLPSDSVDHIFCQQGLQYMGDPDAALREMFRLTKPGGQLSVSVWNSLEANDLLTAQADLVEQIAGCRAGQDARRITIDALGGLESVIELAEGAGYFLETKRTDELEICLPEGYIEHLVFDSPSFSAFSLLDAEGQREAVEYLKNRTQAIGERTVTRMSSVVVTLARPR